MGGPHFLFFDNTSVHTLVYRSSRKRKKIHLKRQFEERAVHQKAKVLLSVFYFEFISLVSDKFSYSVNRLLITFKTTIKKSLQALWNKMIKFYVITTNNCAVKLVQAKIN